MWDVLQPASPEAHWGIPLVHVFGRPLITGQPGFLPFSFPNQFKGLSMIPPLPVPVVELPFPSEIGAPCQVLVEQEFEQIIPCSTTPKFFHYTNLRAMFVLMELPIAINIIPCQHRIKEITCAPGPSTNCPKALKSLLIAIRLCDFMNASLNNQQWLVARGLYQTGQFLNNVPYLSHGETADFPELGLVCALGPLFPLGGRILLQLLILSSEFTKC